ncbi:MAG: hypothetical protein IT165_36765 [Bryobacterales bacterium]|nr:hypothetical protein [Bryobacterales bacterium]
MSSATKARRADSAGWPDKPNGSPPGLARGARAGGIGRAPTETKQQLEAMIPRLEQVIHQARQREMGSDSRVEGEIVSV